MDYFKEAFGGFSPNLDSDAAVKFSLNMLLMEHRISELKPLLTDGHEIGGIEGEPGWMLERRDTGEGGDMPGYNDWPENARFCAWVDEDAYALAYPECFMDRATFHGYVRNALDAYLKFNPQESDLISRLMELAK